MDIGNKLNSSFIGTSTKYDYLSSYASSNGTSKYDKYDRTPSYSRSTSSYATVLDAEDLTRSYFEKYYNKSSSGVANTNGLSHALNVLEKDSR